MVPVGRFGVRVGDRRGDFVDADAVARRAAVDRGRRARRSVPRRRRCTWATPLTIEIRCAMVVSRVFVDRRQRQRRRTEHEEQHRLIAGVDLLVRRRRRHLRRQLARGLRNHRLHVLRGGVDVAAQVELQRDVGAALRAGRVDRAAAPRSSRTAFRAAARPTRRRCRGSRREATR